MLKGHKKEVCCTSYFARKLKSSFLNIYIYQLLHGTLYILYLSLVDQKDQYFIGISQHQKKILFRRLFLHHGQHYRKLMIRMYGLLLIILSDISLSAPRMITPRVSGVAKDREMRPLYSRVEERNHQRIWVARTMMTRLWYQASDREGEEGLRGGERKKTVAHQWSLPREEGEATTGRTLYQDSEEVWEVYPDLADFLLLLLLQPMLNQSTMVTSLPVARRTCTEVAKRMNLAGIVSTIQEVVVVAVVVHITTMTGDAVEEVVDTIVVDVMDLGEVDVINFNFVLFLIEWLLVCIANEVHCKKLWLGCGVARESKHVHIGNCT